MQPVHSANQSILEHPTESQRPGSPPAGLAPADTRIMPECTVNTSPVNNPQPPHQHTVHIPPNSPPPRMYTSSVIHVNAIDINPHISSHITHPSMLYVTLSPKILYQQSIHTAVQQLLLPIAHLSSIPRDTLTKLHSILSMRPQLLTHLPPLPILEPDPSGSHLSLT
jgi:hypothetical protein